MYLNTLMIWHMRWASFVPPERFVRMARPEESPSGVDVMILFLGRTSGSKQGKQV